MYGMDHLVHALAEELYYAIKDLDVCIMIASLYIKKRYITATEETREFYISQIWKEKPGLKIARVPGSLGMLATRMYLWNPDYIYWRENVGAGFKSHRSSFLLRSH